MGQSDPANGGLGPELQVIDLSATRTPTGEFRPLIIWTPVSGVLTYEVAVCVDNPCTLLAQVVETREVTEVAIPDLQEGEYFLEITGFAVSGKVIGKTTAPFPFVIDRTAPAAFALDQPEIHTKISTPEISWSESAEADTYELVIAQTETCATAVQSYPNLATNKHSVDPIEEGRYAVCVTAQDIAGNITRADAGILVIDITPPGPFEVIGPTPVSKDGTPDVVWTASDDGSTYELVISKNATCDEPIQSLSGLTTTTVTLELLGNGNYFACVTASDQAGNKTAATPYPMTIAVEPPGLFTITVPSATKTLPTISWSVAAGAVEYDLNISRNTDCSDPQQSHTALTHRSQALSSLADGFYYACVIAYDIDRNQRQVVSRGFAIDTTPPMIDMGQRRWTGNTFTLRPHVTDATPMTFVWTKITGPGSVTFTPSNSKDTLVRASTEGDYSLRLTATDQAGNTASAEVVLTWDRSRLIALGRADTCAITAGGKLSCWGRNLNGQSGGPDGLMRSSPTAITLGDQTSVLQVAVGGDFTCALLEDGSVRCWGTNTSGQLGYGDIDARNTIPMTAVALGNNRKAVQIAAGSSHVCVILENGQVKCWGLNLYGQLGIGSTTDQWSPPTITVDLGQGLTANELALGEHFSCALLNNLTVKCWGFNNQGQLGLGSGDTSNRTSPSLVVIPGGFTVRKLAAGYRHACVILNNDTVQCWGLGISGQLGDGNLSNSGTPVAVKNITKTPINISASSTTTCLHFIDGSVQCVGGGAPSLAAGRSGFATDCSNGYSSTSSLACTHIGGTVSTLFRDCTNGMSRSPSACAAAGGAWGSCSDFVSTSSATCADTWNPAIYAYCTNAAASMNPANFCSSLGGSMVNEGYCADANYFSRASCLAAGATWHIRRFLGPSLNFGATSKVLAIASTKMGTSNCVVLDDPSLSLTCWGDNSYGQLGYGKSQRERVFQTIFEADVLKVVTATASTCALLTGGRVQCWGSNESGRLGTGNYQDLSMPPVNPVSLSNPAIDLSAGTDAVCALVNDGTMECWGNNTYGRLGSGTITETPSPIPVKNLAGSASHLGVGEELTCAIVNGDVKCWGNISRLGVGVSTPPTACSNGVSTTSTACTSVGGLWSQTTFYDCSNGMSTSATACAAYPESTWAHCSDGTSVSSAACLSLGKTWSPTSYAYCTHSNGTTSASTFCTNHGGSFGRYGYCSISSHTTRAGCLAANASWYVSTLPGVKINLGAAASQVAVSASGGCALITGGKVRCWGDNTYGQVGVGSTGQINHTTAGAIVDFGGELVTSVVAGAYSYCALLDDSSVRCWGRNSSGNLATGDTVNLSKPNPESANFGDNRSVLKIGSSASGTELCVITNDQAVICSGSIAPPFVSGNPQTTPLNLGTSTTPIGVASGSALCVTFADQSLRCAGENTDGQVGIGPTTYSQPATTEWPLRLMETM